MGLTHAADSNIAIPKFSCAETSTNTEVRRHTKVFISPVRNPVKVMRSGWAVTPRRFRRVAIQSMLPDPAFTHLAFGLRWRMSGIASITSSILFTGSTRLRSNMTLPCGSSPVSIYASLV
jgi:hypothetical protein